MKRIARSTSSPTADGEANKKPKLSDSVADKNDQRAREEKRKNKKIQKTLEKVEANPPKFFYSGAELARRKEPVGIDDVRDVVMHFIADAPPSSWLKVENPRNISKVVALWIPGLTPSLLDLPSPYGPSAEPNFPVGVPLTVQSLPFMSKFLHACPTRAPGDKTRMHSVMSAFVSCPVTGEEKKRRLTERIKQERESAQNASIYTLTLDQMIENEYPIPSYVSNNGQAEANGSGSAHPLPEGWVETPKPPSSDESPLEPGKIYAIDCEMCITETNQKALTHVSIVSYDTGEKIYDVLVKPREKITDYLTRFSGVHAEALEGVTTRLEDVQNFLLKLLTPEPGYGVPILLGHSLDSDLKALQLRHPRCIDTSVIFHHPRGAPYKPGLAWLSQKWCDKIIQNHGEGGHNPEEDARACIELLKKKMANGPGFGEFKVDQESIFERITRSSITAGVSKCRRLSVVIDHGNPSTWYGKKADKCISCKTDDEVVDGIKHVLALGVRDEGRGPEEYKLIFARLTDLASGMGWITAKTLTTTSTQPPDGSPTVPADDPSNSDVTEALPKLLSKLNTHLNTIYTALPPRAALLIFSGHDDPRQMASLNTRRSTFEAAYKVAATNGGAVTSAETGEAIKWTAEDLRKLEEETEKAKRGLMFLCLKKVVGH